MEFKKDLEDNKLSEELRKIFEDNSSPISTNVKISMVSKNEWKIIDEMKEYTIKLLPDKINIYEYGRQIKYVICFSKDMAKANREFREGRLRRCKEELEHIKAAVDNGKVRDKITIERRIGKVFGKYPEKYYECKVLGDTQLTVSITLNEDVVRMEEIFDGMYVLRCTVPAMPMKTIIDAYKNRDHVEKAFQMMKTFIKICPIFHHKEPRVQAHVFICYLSYLIERFTENLIRKSGSELTFQTFLEIMEHWKLVETSILSDKHITIIKQNKMSSKQEDILRCLGATEVIHKKISI